jgi:hypothetical protein
MEMTADVAAVAWIGRIRQVPIRSVTSNASRSLSPVRSGGRCRPVEGGS